jgi:hypothetical protein
MNYKTTKLNTQVECGKCKIPDFPEVLFGQMDNGTEVFDATNYFIATETDEVDMNLIANCEKRNIEALVGAGEAKVDNLFFVNKDGHMLINAALVNIFLVSVSKDVFLYFNQMMTDLTTNGAAFSDGFAAMMASSRLPNEVLEKIIESRKEQSQKQ